MGSTVMFFIWVQAGAAKFGSFSVRLSVGIHLVRKGLRLDKHRLSLLADGRSWVDICCLKGPLFGSSSGQASKDGKNRLAR